MKVKSFIPCFPVIVLLFAVQFSLNGQEITLEKIYKEHLFSSKSVRGINSMRDGDHYTINGEGRRIIKYAYSDGKPVDTLFNASQFSEIESFNAYTFHPDETMILLTTEVERIYRRSFRAEYYVFDRSSDKLHRVSNNGKQQLAAFSPVASKIAFVRKNNIFIADLASGEEKQITLDGEKNAIINGAPDWVYEEEFGFSRGFYWSPDGRRIAFYRFDERRVKEFTMTYYRELYPELYTFKYPKAGEKNALVSIHVYDLETGKTSVMDTGDETDQYIPRIEWTRDPLTLSIIRLNRLQNHVEVLHCDAVSGSPEVVYEETNDAYISEATDDMITYLDDGESFVLMSERDACFHLYRYNFKEGTISPITAGEWDVSGIIGIDQQRGRVYYTSYEASTLEQHVYSIKLNGKRKRKLSGNKGYNTASFSASFAYYIMSHSDANNPARYTLYNREGDVIRVLEDNSVLKEETRRHRFSPVEFLTVPNGAGTDLHAYMIKPPNFDPDKEYPLFIYVYGGPESQNVVDRWGRRHAWFQLLAQEGYIIACVDNRGTNGRGEAFRKSTYMQLGKLETEDQLAAARWFGDLAYVDASRMGMFGWSYGGFMTSLCMTKGEGLLKMGIAVAPVTNWKYYDTIYTERFMRTPQENPEGYADNSPIHFADGLEGKFLLIHGSTDDNVHFQNSMEFFRELVKADKQFDMHVYPNKNHGIYGGNTTYHIYRKMTSYILEHL